MQSSAAAGDKHHPLELKVHGTNPLTIS